MTLSSLPPAILRLTRDQLTVAAVQRHMGAGEAVSDDTYTHTHTPNAHTHTTCTHTHAHTTCTHTTCTHTHTHHMHTHTHTHHMHTHTPHACTHHMHTPHAHTTCTHTHAHTHTHTHTRAHTHMHTHSRGCTMSCIYIPKPVVVDLLHVHVVMEVSSLNLFSNVGCLCLFIFPPSLPSLYSRSLTLSVLYITCGLSSLMFCDTFLIVLKCA